MFTKQHYKRIAQAFVEIAGKYESTDASTAVDDVRIYLANELADIFEDDNPRFNRKLFMAAVYGNESLLKEGV